MDALVRGDKVGFGSGLPRTQTPARRVSGFVAKVEGWLTGALNEAVRAAQLADAAAAMPHMRFLIYPEPGGALSARIRSGPHHKT